MTVFGSIGPRPRQPDQPADHDLSYEAAVELTRIDYARLLSEHSISWITDADGRPWLTCCCRHSAYTPVALESHIREVVRKARGPVKK